MSTISPLLAALDRVEVPVCDDYRKVLEGAMEEGQLGEETELAQTLAHAVALQLRPTDREPLVPLFAGASKGVYDFSDSERTMLMQHAEGFDAELRARARDVVWCSKRDAEQGNQAVHDYLETAATLARYKRQAFASRNRLQRALAIARRMRKADLADTALAQAASLVAADDVDPAFLVAVGRILVDEEYGDLTALADRLRATVEGLPSPEDHEATDWEWIRSAWQLVADAERAAGRPEAERDALLSRARTYAGQAAWLKQKGAAASMRANLLRSAVVALRAIDGTEAERGETYQLMEEAQRSAAAELTTVEGPPLDLTDIAKQSMNEVSGLTFREALLALTTLVQPEPVEKLQEEAAATARQSPLWFLIPRQILDAEGRVVRKEAAGGLSDPDAQEAALRSVMVQQMAWRRGALSQGVLDPARRQIAAEHAPAPNDWFTVLNDSPVAEVAKIHAWIRGLDSGLRGDFISSSYILVPLIEHALRVIARQGGAQVTWMNDDGVQEFKLLPSLLADPTIGEILGADFLFEIEALLGKNGQNFRNQLSHGLFRDGSLQSADGIFIWHLALRLLLIPVVLGEMEAPSNDPEAKEVEPV